VISLIGQMFPMGSGVHEHDPEEVERRRQELERPRPFPRGSVEARRFLCRPRQGYHAIVVGAPPVDQQVTRAWQERTIRGDR